jgi:hypothetical protein
MDVNNPLKMVCIGIDPYPYGYNFGIMEYVHGILNTKNYEFPTIWKIDGENCKHDLHMLRVHVFSISMLVF